MRRVLLLLTVGLTCWSGRLPAQDRAEAAAARALRDEAEDRYKVLNGKIESVAETQEVLLKNQEKLQQRISLLASEIDEMRRSHTQAGASYVTRDQLKDLVEKMQEIDRKRAADKELILQTLKELQKIPVSTTRVTEKPPASTPTVEEPAGPTWDYVVKANDTLQKIVLGYNEELEKRGLAKLTVNQVLKANPGLNPNKLYAGRKILIPIPPKKEEKSGRNHP